MVGGLQAVAAAGFLLLAVTGQGPTRWTHLALSALASVAAWRFLLPPRTKDGVSVFLVLATVSIAAVVTLVAVQVTSD